MGTDTDRLGGAMDADDPSPKDIESLQALNEAVTAAVIENTKNVEQVRGMRKVVAWVAGVVSLAVLLTVLPFVAFCGSDLPKHVPLALVVGAFACFITIYSPPEGTQRVTHPYIVNHNFEESSISFREYIHSEPGHIWPCPKTPTAPQRAWCGTLLPTRLGLVH